MLLPAQLQKRVDRGRPPLLALSFLNRFLGLLEGLVDIVGYAEIHVAPSFLVEIINKEDSISRSSSEACSVAGGTPALPGASNPPPLLYTSAAFKETEMPKVALADLKLDWGQLLAAAEPYREDKRLKDELALLRSAYGRLHELTALRDELQAKRQQATQEMGAVKDEGKVAAMRVRSMLRGILGTTNERLVQFGVAPRRPRRRRSKPAEPTAPAAPRSRSK